MRNRRDVFGPRRPKCRGSCSRRLTPSRCSFSARRRRGHATASMTRSRPSSLVGASRCCDSIFRSWKARSDPSIRGRRDGDDRRRCCACARTETAAAVVRRRTLVRRPMASHAVLDATWRVHGLIFCSFPLHPAGQPEPRADHLDAIEVPMLFCPARVMRWRNRTTQRDRAARCARRTRLARHRRSWLQGAEAQPRAQRLGVRRTRRRRGGLRQPPLLKAFRRSSSRAAPRTVRAFELQSFRERVVESAFTSILSARSVNQEFSRNLRAIAVWSASVGRRARSRRRGRWSGFRPDTVRR